MRAMQDAETAAQTFKNSQDAVKQEKQNMHTKVSATIDYVNSEHTRVKGKVSEPPKHVFEKHERAISGHP